jgi:hypothetical protein
MPTYDATLFDPPAPLARVTLRNPRNGTIVHEIIMLIDSGADATIIPLVAADHIGVIPLPDQSYELKGLDGRTS